MILWDYETLGCHDFSLQKTINIRKMRYSKKQFVYKCSIAVLEKQFVVVPH